MLEARDFFVNQAQLTGEAYPVEKRAGPAAGADDWAPEAEPAVFMGSTVVSGSARVLVGRTGSGTALGQIADSLALAPPPTAFERGTRHFGLLINLDSSVERARVCGFRVVWQGALSCQCAQRAGARKDKQGLGRRLLAA